MRALLLLSPSSPVLEPSVKEDTITTPVVTCDSQTCPWKPYSNSKDFQKDAWLIFAILFFLLFLAITLNAAVRCIIRRRRRRRQPQPVDSSDDMSPTKPPPTSDAIEIKGEVVLFSSSSSSAIIKECAICLSEFEEGDRVRVLDGCKHGFHVHCIKEWLSATHSSCPICRANSITTLTAGRTY
ncbi:RING-H2 finger protein ATL79-like [Impatiens glandulifera]|uniref:RING-H2 finger protein ATL79-like n=1 Tax=Impatiens glandulifera TaxID=253017 RepID=UPI001FB105D7|nr:RING-H2 finger protein ATL79-like [Impatiens glandulifera]